MELGDGSKKDSQNTYGNLVFFFISWSPENWWCLMSFRGVPCQRKIHVLNVFYICSIHSWAMPNERNLERSNDWTPNWIVRLRATRQNTCRHQRYKRRVRPARVRRPGPEWRLHLKLLVDKNGLGNTNGQKQNSHETYMKHTNKDLVHVFWKHSRAFLEMPNKNKKVDLTGVGKCPNGTSPNYWGYNLRQIFEGDVQNYQKETFTNPCLSWWWLHGNICFASHNWHASCKRFWHPPVTMMWRFPSTGVPKNHPSH